MKGRKWCILFLIFIMLFLLNQTFITVKYDPFFHYHGPRENEYFNLINPLYQNIGIIKNFNYEGVIIGTSMVRNFPASKAEEIFGKKFIKLPFCGSGYKEIADNIDIILENKPNIQYIIRSLDLGYIKKNDENYKENLIEYPVEFLYNKSIIDDVHYIFNKEIFFSFTKQKIKGIHYKYSPMTFDRYGSDIHYTYGKEAVLKSYVRPNKLKEKEMLPNEKNTIINNLNNHVLDTIEANPEIQFYLFYPPYNIVYWDFLHRTNNLKKFLEMEKMITEAVLNYENVHLFSFWLDKEFITNFDYYKDKGHYNDIASAYILDNMNQEKNMLTLDNYEEYYKQVKDFFTNYDYDQYFE